MNNIYVLYLGTDDWFKKHTVPEHIEYLVCDNWCKLSEEEQKRVADVVILDRNIFSEELAGLQKITRGYCLFATEHVDMKDSITVQYFDGKMGQFLYTGDMEAFMAQETLKYFNPPYGEKFSFEFLTVNPSFKGSVSCAGNHNLLLEGDFGDEYAQIAYWRNTIPVFPDQIIDLYLEHRKTGTVQIKLRAIQFYNGSADGVRKVWEFDEDELDGIVMIGPEKDYGPVFMSILAKGEGSLNIISLHDRYSRSGRGYFLPGGERYVSSKGEEFFTYFEKGDMKPPLAVYFSGWRAQEGFEGYYMMRGFGCPFMLFTDPRLKGGAFYTGNDEYETMILDALKEKIEQLGFSDSDVVLTGASMGTYGALYYGTRIMPHALILAKPITNMGTVAENERLVRAGMFGSALDVTLKNYGSLDADAVEAFDKRLWKYFDKTDWSHTKFIVSYLYEDDYDTYAYVNILSHLKSSGVEVFGKGSHGRHNDNTASVMEWFRSQYDKLLEEDYGRRRRIK